MIINCSSFYSETFTHYGIHLSNNSWSSNRFFSLKPKQYWKCLNVFLWNKQFYNFCAFHGLIVRLLYITFELFIWRWKEICKASIAWYLVKDLNNFGNHFLTLLNHRLTFTEWSEIKKENCYESKKYLRKKLGVSAVYFLISTANSRLEQHCKGVLLNSINLRDQTLGFNSQSKTENTTHAGNLITVIWGRITLE